jgi:hypothetical protein
VTPPAAAAAPAIHPRRTVGPGRGPLAVPRKPRRVSGPARGTDRARVAQPAPAAATQRLLDRLISGRAWIGLVAFALIGIVTMQLGLLELNGGIGRALEHEALLQRENAALSIENSEMAAGDRVELRAAQMGMELVPAGALRFLPARPGIDAARAAAALSAPPVHAAPTTSSAEAPAGGSETQAPSSSSTEAPGTISGTTASTESPQTAEPSTTASAASPPAGESAVAPSAESRTTPAEPAPTSATTASTGGDTAPAG